MELEADYKTEFESLKELFLEYALQLEELYEIHKFGDIVGQGPSFQNLMKLIELVAPTDACVLILGESGTGKELVANERENLIAALQKCTWKIYGDDGAAKLLGIKPTTLSARIKKFGI